MSTIRLYIEKDSRRTSLARALEEEFEVLTGRPSEDGEQRENLLILDHTTLHRNRPEALSSYRLEGPQSESPILLLVPSTQVSTIETSTWEQIDDVVAIPVRWPEMKSRVQNLIRLQEHARDERHFRKLAAKYKVMLQEQDRQRTVYKSLFDNLLYGTIVLDDLEILEANQQAQTLFGTEDLAGQTVGSVSSTHQPDGRKSVEKMRELLGDLGEKPQSIEWTFQQAGGDTFRSDILLSPVEFGDEECVQVLFAEERPET